MSKITVVSTAKGDRLKIDGKFVDFKRSPNGGGEMTPRYLVIHYTAGGSAHSSVNWMTNSKANASAHLVIDEYGGVTQLMPFNEVAWHAGESSWDGIRGLNRHSIGIEVSNPGNLEISGEDYVTWWGDVVNPESVVEAIHPDDPSGNVYGWKRFTPEQIKAIIDIGTVLTDHYELVETVGHDMISPGRKKDPGPCMPDNVYGFLNGRNRDENVYEVFGTSGKGLNCRTHPGIDNHVHDFSPFPNGTRITVEDRHGKWLLVRLVDEPHHEGWCHGNWIKRL